MVQAFLQNKEKFFKGIRVSAIFFSELSVRRRVCRFIALGAALREDVALAFEFLPRLLELFIRQAARLQELVKRLNPKAIQPPMRPRELILMPAALDNQGRFDEMDGVGFGDAQPQIIIFAGGQGFVEIADFIEYRAPHQRGRWADDAERQAMREDMAAVLLVLFHLIDADAAPNPDFFGMAEGNVRLRLHGGDLRGKLFRQPEIIGIEQRDIAALRGANARVSRAADAAIRLKNRAEAFAVCRKQIAGAIRRAIVNDNQFEIAKRLRKN